MGDHVYDIRHQHSHFLAGLLLAVSFPAVIVALIFFRIMCLAA
jgi:hypothetical protein